MKAMVRERYGPADEVLEMRDIPVPEIGSDEVLVRVVGAAVNAGDVAVVEGMPYLVRVAYGLSRPRRPLFGSDIAGVVADVGAGVTRFQVGDEVFGCGRGAFAELVSAPEARLALKPANLSFIEAAAIPVAGLTALQGLRDAAGVETGQSVLINGASGGVGTFAIQVARSLGAEVTAVCSTPNLEMARSLGAHHVIDYTKDDFTDAGARYDVVFDNAASHTLRATRQALVPGGILVPNHGNLHSRWFASLPRMVAALASSPFVPSRTRLHAQSWSADDLTLLGDMAESGDLTPVIDRGHDLADLAAAVSYVKEGHARGKVVIDLQS